MAANEKSHYLPSAARTDAEGLEVFAESIEQNLSAVIEEREVGRID